MKDNNLNGREVNNVINEYNSVESNNKSKRILIGIIIIIVLFLVALTIYVVIDNKDKDVNVGSNNNQDKDVNSGSNNNQDKDVNSGSNNNQEIQNDLPQNDNLNELTGKVDFNSYCFDNNCKKDIGILNINNKKFKLSVELENLNTNNVSGKIILGTSELNISELSYISLEKVFDGFEVYNDYLILYMSNLDTMKNKKTNCEVRGYIMYILNSNLDQVSAMAGYTKNNAFKDIKIENGILYYYALASGGSDKYQAHLTYNKIDFNDLLNKNYDNNISISSFDECAFGELW